ncbi:BrnA antitoxin family protein [Halomonas litopenaei]|uniref:BrnA antitoxin family protein n=1 Tax=Halomonas litopenaei TaxID=2109328 RepID=UPI003F9EF803
MSVNKGDSTPTWVDPDDAPELTEEWLEGAHFYRGDQLLKRGRGRPPLERPKVAVKVRYDQDVIDTFRASGKGWQTRMNLALRRFLAEHDVSELDQR